MTEIKLENIQAKEIKRKTVKAISNVGHVYLPVGWVGKEVIVILEEDEKMEKIEKSVILRYKNVEIESKVEMNDEDMTVYFWNTNNGNWSERVDQVFSGWSFQEDELNDEMEELIEFVKKMDEQYFADANESEIYFFDENGYISS